MPNSEWPRETIESIAAPNGVIGGPFGSDLVRSDYRESGIPVIRGGNLGGDRKFDTSDLVFVSEEKAASLSRNQAMPGDIVVTQRGTLGQVGIVPRNGRFSQWIISQSQMRIRCGSQRALPEFVYYCLLCPETIAFIKANAVAAGVPHINLGFLKALRIPCPPLGVQHAVVSVLGALDDKIEMNRRTNETLEGLFRAAFESAVAMGNTCKLGDIVGEHRILVDPMTLSPEVPYIGLEHMPRGSITLDAWGSASEVESGKLKFDRDCVLFGKLRPYFRKVGAPSTEGVCSSDILVLRPDAAFFEIALGYLASQPVIDHANSGATGTRMPRASWREIAKFVIRVPTRDALLPFSALGRSLRERMNANVFENRTLAEIRDRLLPKLVSGEIRVREAEKAVGEAV